MAQYEEFTIDQGADVAIEIRCLDPETNSAKNLTNYSVAAKMKRNYNSDSADTVNFTSIVSNPPTAGIITLGLTNNQTDSLKAGRYVYDVELTDSANVVSRVLEGIVTITPGVTR